MDKLIKSAIDLFNQKGVKFTLDELATQNKISKKTIYKQYGDKEKVIELAIMNVFDSIKTTEREILENLSLSKIEKLKQYLCVFPSFEVNYEYVVGIKEQYPNAYKKIHERFEDGWEGTQLLVSQAIEEGLLENFDFGVLKVLLVGVYNEVVLMDEHIQKETLRKAIDFLIDGHLKA